MLFLVATLLGGISVSSAQSTPSDAEARPPVGHLLQSMFAPDRTPPHKTMGLAQRNFMDLAAATQSKLQVALIIDGTESMGDNLEAAKQTIGQMLQDLSGYRIDTISYQLVIYRDYAAGEGHEVSFPLNRSAHSFTSDTAELARALAGVKAGSGAPYFPEVVDLGLHAAITELAWDESDETTRWILLFADAPPFASGFAEESTHASRRYATDQLVALANRKNILIHCILCTSREREYEVYKKVLPDTQLFMSTLSTETGGLMIDLSYKDIQQTLREAVDKTIVQRETIRAFDQADILRVREEAQAQKKAIADDQRTRLAVLPHVPLDQMTFDPSRDEVRVAAELRQKFREVPGTDVKAASSVKTMFTLLRRQRLSDEQLLQLLAERLKVDYVVWGQMKPINAAQGTIEVQSAVYGRESGQPLMRSVVVRANTKATPAENLSGKLAVSLMSAGQTASDARLANRFRLVASATPLQEDLVRPVSTSPASRDHIWTALELLEQATAYLSSDEEGQKLVARAEQELEKAVDPATGDPTSPFAHFLRSTTLLNQSQYLALRGDKDQARNKARAMRNALNLAYREKSRATKGVEREIEADYALFGQRNVPEAIAAYGNMASQPDANSEPRLHAALHAHWMLAGIYCGDWNVPQDTVDQEKARDHLIQILAFWPDSPEATIIRQTMLWDEKSGELKYPQFPKQGETVTGLLES